MVRVLRGMSLDMRQCKHVQALFSSTYASTSHYPASHNCYCPTHAITESRLLFPIRCHRAALDNNMRGGAVRNEKGPVLGRAFHARATTERPAPFGHRSSHRRECTQAGALKLSGLGEHVADDLRKLQCLLVLKTRNASARSNFSDHRIKRVT